MDAVVAGAMIREYEAQRHQGNQATEASRNTEEPGNLTA